MAKNFFGITDTGRARENNEDAFIAQKVRDNRFIAACVIDGVGGYEGGEVAAAIARDTLLAELKDTKQPVPDVLRSSFILANERILTEKQQGGKNDRMACVLTFALADLVENLFYYAHVGDTRLYLLRDSSLVKVSKDHSFVGFLEDSGRLTEDAAMTHPKRNEINKALGFGGQIEQEADYIETGQSPFLPGDLLLLCSDGLTDLVNRQEMLAILESGDSLEQKAKALIDAANERGGKDNITVVLVVNDKAPSRQKATKPVLVKKKDREDLTPGAEITSIAEAEKNLQTNEKKAPARSVTNPKRGTSGLVVFLSLLSLALVGVVAWLLTTRNSNPSPVLTDPQSAVTRNISPQEKKLRDTLLKFTGDTLLLTEADFGRYIFLSDTLFINRDSLSLKAAPGVVLNSDSTYHGPAIVLGPQNRYLSLDQMSFEDFNTVVVASGQKVRLNKVHFHNAVLPVQYGFAFSGDQLFSGQLGDSTWIKKDSLPNKNN
jgi:serine/threonine protein phosphatase PrpC